MLELIGSLKINSILYSGLTFTYHLKIKLKKQKSNLPNRIQALNFQSQTRLIAHNAFKIFIQFQYKCVIINWFEVGRNFFLDFIIYESDITTQDIHALITKDKLGRNF
jgi:hypothetical protein